MICLIKYSKIKKKIKNLLHCETSCFRFWWTGKLYLRRITKIKIYSALATIFWLVRQFAIPNPFEALGEGLTITIGEAPLLLPPELLNWIADPIIAAITFAVVGLYYIKGSEPALGSILYMVFYAVHIGLLYLLLNIYPIIWLMIVVAVIYIALHITILVIKNSV